jgi:hypothetical protein
MPAETDALQQLNLPRSRCDTAYQVKLAIRPRTRAIHHYYRDESRVRGECFHEKKPHTSWNGVDSFALDCLPMCAHEKKQRDSDGMTRIDQIIEKLRELVWGEGYGAPRVHVSYATRLKKCAAVRYCVAYSGAEAGRKVRKFVLLQSTGFFAQMQAKILLVSFDTENVQRQVYEVVVHMLAVPDVFGLP